MSSLIVADYFISEEGIPIWNEHKYSLPSESQISKRTSEDKMQRQRGSKICDKLNCNSEKLLKRRAKLSCGNVDRESVSGEERYALPFFKQEHNIIDNKSEQFPPLPKATQSDSSTNQIRRNQSYYPSCSPCKNNQVTVFIEKEYKCLINEEIKRSNTRRINKEDNNLSCTEFSIRN